MKSWIATCFTPYNPYSVSIESRSGKMPSFPCSLTNLKRAISRRKPETNTKDLSRDMVPFREELHCLYKALAIDAMRCKRCLSVGDSVRITECRGILLPQLSISHPEIFLLEYDAFLRVAIRHTITFTLLPTTLLDYSVSRLKLLGVEKWRSRCDKLRPRRRRFRKYLFRSPIKYLTKTFQTICTKTLTY